MTAPGTVAEPGRDNNSLDCARAVEANWRGQHIAASAMADADIGGAPARYISAWAGGRFERLDADGLGARVVQSGPGSSAIVVLSWAGGGAHACNVVNQNGAVQYIDGQTGEAGAWPPVWAGFPEIVARIDAVLIGPNGAPSDPLGQQPPAPAPLPAAGQPDDAAVQTVVARLLARSPGRQVPPLASRRFAGGWTVARAEDPQAPIDDRYVGSAFFIVGDDGRVYRSTGSWFPQVVAEEYFLRAYAPHVPRAEGLGPLFLFDAFGGKEFVRPF